MEMKRKEKGEKNKKTNQYIPLAKAFDPSITRWKI